MQEELATTQLVRMTLEPESAAEQTDAESEAEYGANVHWSTSAEGTTQDVACPDAHYLLIEFEAAECALDARASLMVTGSDGACVAHVTGPSYCWPSTQVLVSGSTCRFQLRGGGGRQGNVVASVSGHRAPQCPPANHGWEVQLEVAVAPAAAACELRMPLRLGDLQQAAEAARGSGGGSSAAPPEVSATALRLVELGAKSVLHTILEGIVHHRDELLAERARDGEAASALVTPETVERVLRRVLPQSLHRLALEECLSCQRAHQLVLHANTAPATGGLNHNPPTGSDYPPGYQPTAPRFEPATPNLLTTRSSTGPDYRPTAPMYPIPDLSSHPPYDPFNPTPPTGGPAYPSPTQTDLRPVEPPAAAAGAAAAPTPLAGTAAMRMGLMVPTYDMSEANLAQVVTVQAVAEWCQAVCQGIAFQSEVYLHFKAIVQHVAVALVTLGATMLRTSPLYCSHAAEHEADRAVAPVEPAHILRGLAGTALGELLSPTLIGHSASLAMVAGGAQHGGCGGAAAASASSHAVVALDGASKARAGLAARWCPPCQPPHWLPQHRPILAGLAGSVAAHLLQGDAGCPARSAGAGGAPSPCVKLLLCAPFSRGMQRDAADAAMLLVAGMRGAAPALTTLTATSGDMEAAAVVREGLALLEEWAIEAAGPSATPELTACLHMVAVTMGLLAGVNPALPLAPASKPAKSATRVYLQHLSTMKVELLGLKVRGGRSYQELQAAVRTSCEALLRFAAVEAAPAAAAAASADRAGDDRIPSTSRQASAAAAASGAAERLAHVWAASAKMSPSAATPHTEDLQALLGCVRQTVAGELAQRLLATAAAAEKATATALDAFAAVLRMLAWRPDCAQIAVTALLATWPPSVHYLAVALGASAPSTVGLRGAAHQLLASIVRLLSAQHDGKALEATLVQVMLRRLDAADVAFLVEQTPLLAVLEHQLAIAGARLNGGGDAGRRMWRLLCVLVLHLGTEASRLAPSTVRAVLGSVRVVLGCAFDQMYLGANASSGRCGGPGGLPRTASEPLDAVCTEALAPEHGAGAHAAFGSKEHEGVACIHKLVVSSGDHNMDSLMDLQNDTAWMPQDAAPSITVHVTPGLGLQRVWLWIPTDRDGSRQSLEVEVHGGPGLDSLALLTKRTFASAEEARAAFQPSALPGVGGDFLLVADAAAAAALAHCRVVQLRFKQPMLNSRVFMFSLTEEDMYRLKIYGMRLSAAPVVPATPRSGTRGQLASLVEVAAHLLQVLREAAPVRQCLRDAAREWLHLFLRALRTPHALGPAGPAGDGGVSTHGLRLRVVQLLPFVLRGQMTEADLETAYRALLENVLVCSPEALLLPPADSGSAAPAAPYEAAAGDLLGAGAGAGAGPAAPTLKLRQALIAMLRRQVVGDDASPVALKVLCQRMESTGRTPGGAGFAGSNTVQAVCTVRDALPAVLILGGFTDGLLGPAPDAAAASRAATRCTTLAGSEAMLCVGAGAASGTTAGAPLPPPPPPPSPPTAHHRLDPMLIRVFLDMCDRGLAAQDPESFAALFLRTRAAKAMWELMVLPEFAAELAGRKSLLRALSAAAGRLTKVPLDGCIESLAARSMALCAFSATPTSPFDVRTMYRSLKGKWAAELFEAAVEAAAKRGDAAAATAASAESSAGGDGVLSPPAGPGAAPGPHCAAPTDVLLEAEEVMLQEIAKDLDTSLLLQATSEPEVLMHEDHSATAGAAGAAGRAITAGAGSPQASNWVDQAVQGVPLQVTSASALLADLFTTEDALYVYFSRLVLLQLLQQRPEVAASLMDLGMGSPVALLRPLFVCPPEVIDPRLPMRCPRPLVHAHDGAVRTLRAADAAFAAWAGAVRAQPPHERHTTLAALQELYLREVAALQPPKGAELDECIHSVVVESPHEYKNRTLFARKLTIPEACSLCVTFDPRCSTEKKCDYLAFYAHEEDWRNSKPPLRTCDGPPGSTGWKSNLVVKGSVLVYAFHSDKRNTDWGYKFTVQGLNKRGEPRSTRSFILEGVHPGKERNFSGSETLQVYVGAGQTPPPGLQLQFHPTCTVEKPDQQLVMGDVLYSGAVGSAAWPTTAHVRGGRFECSFTCTKQKSCVFKWRVAVQPTAAPAPGQRRALAEATAAPPHITTAPFVHWLMRNMLAHFLPAVGTALPAGPAALAAAVPTVNIAFRSPREKMLCVRPPAAAAAATAAALAAAQAPAEQLHQFFRTAAIRLLHLVIDPKLAPSMHTLLLRSVAELLRLSSGQGEQTAAPGSVALLTEASATTVSQALWGAAAAQYGVEHRSIGTHTCFASPLLSALCEAACATEASASAADRDLATGALRESPVTSPWAAVSAEATEGGAGGNSGSAPRRSASLRLLRQPRNIAEAAEEARSQYLHCRQFLYCRLWELMRSMAAEAPLPQWVRAEVQRSLSKGDSAAWALPVFEKCGDGCTMTSHSVTFTRRCTVLCNRPMFRSSGVYTCDFKIDEGRQILVGVALPDSHTETYLGDDPMKLAWGYMNSGRVRSLSSWTSHRLDTFDEGDIITVKVDTNRGKLSFCKNGTAVGIEETVTQWPMVFAAGGSRMGATTITNATHDGIGTSGASGGVGTGDAVGVVNPPAYLTSPLATMDNTDGWNLFADTQLLAYAAERAAERKLSLMQLNPEDLFDTVPDAQHTVSLCPHPMLTATPSGGRSSAALSQSGSGLQTLMERMSLSTDSDASPKAGMSERASDRGDEGAGAATNKRPAEASAAWPEAEAAGSKSAGGFGTEAAGSPAASPTSARRPGTGSLAFQGSPAAGTPPGIRARRSASAQLSAANRFVTLAERPQEALKARFAVLQLYNNLCHVCLPLLAGSWLGRELHRSKLRLFPETKAQSHDLALSLTALAGTVPSVSINRARATAGRSKKHSVFRQLFDKLEGQSMRTAQHASMLWHVSFEGEGGIDQGGLFRESLMEMSKELHSDAMALFVECPNKRRGWGSNIDKWVPNSSCTSAQDLAMYRFLGAVMGGVLRTKNVLALDLPPLFWKQLLGEPTSISDLANMDEQQVQLLDRIRSAEDYERWSRVTGHSLCFLTEDSRGQLRALRLRNGSPAPVTFEDREAYCAEVVRFRLGEFAAQIGAIREGLLRSVPELVLSLMTWQELENAVCGKPEIKIDVLKSMTAMNLPPATAHIGEWFWSVLHSFTNKDRAAFLAFACGRSRLPSRGSGTVLTVNMDPSKGDAHCPTSHTCTLTIHLPAYTSEEVLRERLIYAIHNCREIDTDFAARDFGASGELLMELYNLPEEEEEEEEDAEDGDAAFSDGLQSFGISMHQMERQVHEASISGTTGEVWGPSSAEASSSADGRQAIVGQRQESIRQHARMMSRLHSNGTSSLTGYNEEAEDLYAGGEGESDMDGDGDNSAFMNGDGTGLRPDGSNLGHSMAMSGLDMGMYLFGGTHQNRRAARAVSEDDAEDAESDDDQGLHFPRTAGAFLPFGAGGVEDDLDSLTSFAHRTHEGTQEESVEGRDLHRYVMGLTQPHRGQQ